MSRQRRAILALAGAMVAASCAFLGRGGVARLHPFQADRHLHFAFDWPRGTTYDYAFTWRGESAVDIPELGGGGANDAKPEVGGKVSFGGELLLESYGKTGDTYRLAAQITRLPTHALEMFGKDVLASDAVANENLVGPKATVNIDAYGTVRAVYFDKSAPPMFQHVMRQLLTLAEVGVHADGATAWAVDETTTLGHGVASYEVEAIDPARIVRTRAPYETVLALPGRTLKPVDQRESDHATITLDPRGVVASLVDDETLAVNHAGATGSAATKKDFTSSSHFTLDLQSVGVWSPIDVDLEAQRATHPGEVVASEDATLRMLNQRVHGLTFEDMKTSLVAFGFTGKLPAGDWLLRASGLLKLHPELCMDLVAVFEDAGVNDRARLQIANLLAGTGTPEAQTAMRAAFESPSAHGAKATYAALIQSFSAVAHPTPESLAFVAAAFTEARGVGDDKAASALALGGAAGNALRSGDVARARSYDATLVRALGEARTAKEKRALLGAVGNVGLADDLDDVTKLAHDDDEDVRAAAAWALRKNDTSDAVSTLVSFAADASPTVEASAFQALAYEPLAATDLAALAKVVTSGATSPPSDVALLSLLVAHPDGGEPVRQMLEFMLARNGADNAMLANIRHVLAAMT